MDYDPIALGQRIRLAYAEHLLRCTDPPPSEMEELLSLDGDLEQAWRWLAFGIAKRRYDPAEVRGLLIYLFSNYYPPWCPILPRGGCCVALSTTRLSSPASLL
jgi:hypothetical protein